MQNHASRTIQEASKSTKRGNLLAELSLLMVFIAWLFLLGACQAAETETTQTRGTQTSHAGGTTQDVDVTRRRVAADLMALHSALDNFALNNGGQYPDSLELLVIPDENGHTYLGQRTVPTDPWNREYGYEKPEKRLARPRIFTLGADGMPGGVGENADVSNLSLLGKELLGKE